MNRLRQQLAYWLAASYGVTLFVLFVAPLQLFLLNLAEEHLGPALLAGGLMVVGFVGTIRHAGRWLDVSANPAPPGAARRAALRLFRRFVGNGDIIQAIVRRIDPHWRNPYVGRTPHETARWLTSMELIHWAVLVGSVSPIIAAFYFNHRTLGFVYLAANVLYNVAPNLVIRDTRRRLLRIMNRSAKVDTGSLQPVG